VRRSRSCQQGRRRPGSCTRGRRRSGLAGQVDATKRWAGLSRDRKRAVTDAVLTIMINPSKRGGRGWDEFAPATITVTCNQSESNAEVAQNDFRGETSSAAGRSRE
jgi:hypothetical protein